MIKSQPLWFALILIFIPFAVSAEDATPENRLLTLHVVSDDGSAPSNIVADIGKEAIAADADGKISLLISGRQPLQIKISADDHYSMMHTVSPLRPANAPFASIQLVRKKSERRLILFAGDTMLGRRFFEPRANEAILVRRDNVLEDGKKLLRLVKPYVELADFASVNLETQLSSGKLSNPLPKSVTFYAPDELAPLLKWSGFDYVALGNNHSFDYREPGLRSTFRAVEAAGLGYSGAGLDKKHARQPYVSKIDGQSVAFLSYVGWAGSFTPTQSANDEHGGAALGRGDVFIDDIAALAEESLSVLQHHSGIEYAEYPALSEVSDLRTAVDAGVDIAIGHHPHVTQGLEIYRDRLIAYSMGNFLFDQYIYSTQAGMLLYVWMDGEELFRAEIVPLNINGYVPTPATGAFRHAVLTRLAGLSSSLGTCLHQSGSHAILGDGIDCEIAELGREDLPSGSMPRSLWRAGVSPVTALRFESNDRQFRVGINLLPRGDFESAGLFGSPVRAWLTGPHAQLIPADDPSGRSLQVTLANSDTVRTGMKVFERAFALSSPATVSGIVRSNGPAILRFYMQRRRIDQGFEDELKFGPLTEIGQLLVADHSVDNADWQSFAFEHRLPRLPTKSIRLLIEVQRISGSENTVEVTLDDIAWVEWRTPWVASDEDVQSLGTHVQFRDLVRL